MNINYDFAKQEINKILQQIGDKNSWREVSFHLRVALNLIDEKSKKESKIGEKIESQNWILKNGKMMSPSEAKKVIKKIDNLIELESEKLHGQNAEIKNDDTTLID